MNPIYQTIFSMLQQATDWLAILLSTFFLGLVIVDYFAWCMGYSKQASMQTSKRAFL